MIDLAPWVMLILLILGLSIALLVDYVVVLRRHDESTPVTPVPHRPAHYSLRLPDRMKLDLKRRP